MRFQNMGASDAAHEALRRHVALMASVKSSLLVEVQSPGSWGDEVAAALRAHARRAIAAAADGDVVAAAVGTAVVIGDRAGLEPDLVSRLQQAGTFHVIAISGGNIALIVFVVMAVIRRLTTRRTMGALCAAAVLVGYAVLVGGGASVVRATGMALIGIAALAADLRSAALNVLALTAVILVVADPLLTVDTAFWLTCMATGAMVIGLPPSMTRSRSWRERLRIALLSSVWAEAALLPIVATVFQQVTLAGLVLNIVAIPGMALVQASAMAAVGAEPVSGWLVAASGAGLRLGAWLVVGPARLVEWCPWLVWRVSPPGAVAVVGYYVSAGAWIWSHRAASSRATRLRIPSTVLGVSMTVWVAVAPFDFVRRAPRDLRLTTLDVGQGDSLLLQFPNGTRMLLDGGASSPGGFDVGARVVGPALRARGIRTLDYVVVTHADADHIGGVAALVREFQPREVWTGVPVDGDEATARVRAAADRVGAVWRPLQRGERVNVGPVDVAVLHPPRPEWDRQRVRNDDSVVLGVTWGDVRFLLTGDIGEAVERDLLSAFPDLAKPMTVLKVAHHGSGGSSAAPFLEHVHPTVALISAGADNPFGHPTRLTLDRLGAVAADVWRTDRDGEITARTDGRALEVVAPVRSSALVRASGAVAPILRRPPRPSRRSTTRSGRPVTVARTSRRARPTAPPCA